MTSLITAWTVPVAKHTYRNSEQDIRNDERQDQVSQIVVPGVPCDYVFRICAAVEARKGFAHVFESIGKGIMIRFGNEKYLIQCLPYPNSLANSVQLTLGG